MGSAGADRVHRLLEPALEAAGYVLEDVVVRAAGRRSLVQVVVDREGGVSLDDVAEASQVCSAVLDDADPLPGTYVLEVSSPGTDRPLALPRHWRRNIGRVVEVRRRAAATLTGRLCGADDDGATLDVAGQEHRVAYADVVRAVVQVEFHRAADHDPGTGPAPDAPLEGEMP